MLRLQTHFLHKPCNLYCTILHSMVIFRNMYVMLQQNCLYFSNPSFEILGQDCLWGEGETQHLSYFLSQDPHCIVTSKDVKTFFRMGHKRKALGRKTNYAHAHSMTKKLLCLHAYSYLHGPFPFIPQGREKRDPSQVLRICLSFFVEHSQGELSITLLNLVLK